MNYSFLNENQNLGSQNFHMNSRMKNEEKMMNNYLNQNSKFGSYNITKYISDDYKNNLNHLGMSQQQNKDQYGSYVDTESNLKKPNFTSEKVRQQLLTRPFVTTGYMGAGATHIVNPDQYSKLVPGLDTKTKKAADTLAGVSQDRFIPLVPCIAKNIQDPIHIVPQYWVRGGESSRAILQNTDYFKECGLK